MAADGSNYWYKNLTNQRDYIVPLPAGMFSGPIPDTPRHKFINRFLVEPY